MATVSRLRHFDVATHKWRSAALFRLFWPNTEEVAGGWGDRMMRNCKICIPHQIFLGYQMERKWSEGGVWERRGKYRVWVGKTKVKLPRGRPRRRWKDNKINIQQVGWGAWSGLIWLRTWTDSVMLLTLCLTFGFHKMRGISWLAEEFLASVSGDRMCILSLDSFVSGSRRRHHQRGKHSSLKNRE
jgi:hypothetical protein